MKITYIISEIDKAVYFENTALTLRAADFDIGFILINSEKGYFFQFLKENQFEVINLNCPKIRKSWDTIKHCKQHLKNQKPDIVHCHLANGSWIGLWAGKLAGIKKRIYTRHSGESLTANWKENVIDQIQNRLATNIVAISKSVEQLLIKQGVSKHKIAVIHHGFNLNRFSSVEKSEVDRISLTYNPEKQSPVIGVVARWLELKGIQFIIDAFIVLLESYPNALLCLFGGGKGGEFHKEIHQRLEKIPTKNYRIVRFEPNVFALYSLFDVYVHVPINSNCEAFGQTYIEALAAGCPSVFTLSGVASEFIVDEQNALQVPFSDSTAIKNQITRILTDDELRKKLITNGKKSVLPFSIESHIRKLKELYEL